MDEADTDFRITARMYGSDADIDYSRGCRAAVSSVGSTPKPVILKEAQGIWNAKSTHEGLAPYVGHHNATTVFAIVFKGGALNKTSALLRMAEKSDAVIFNSPVPRS